MTGELMGRSDVKHKPVLEFPKNRESKNQRGNSTCKRSNHRLRGGQYAVIDAQPEAVQNKDEGIQLEEPPVFRGKRLDRVQHRCDVEPDLKHDLQNVRHIAVKDIQSREKEGSSDGEKSKGEQR